MDQLIAIGDIHGSMAPLLEIIKKTSEYRGYQYVFLGDYIDRGNEPYAVIDTIKKLDAIYLIGNHETMLFDVIDCTDSDAQKNHFLNMKGISVENYQWLKDNCRSFYNTENYYFSHAGLNPKKNIENQDIFDLTWNTYDGPYPQLKNKLVIHGHISADEVEINENNININTGCGENGGYLTALVLPQMEFIKSRKIRKFL